MRFMFLILAIIFAAYSAGIGQTRKVECPAISIVAPTQMLVPARPATFAAKMSDQVGSERIYYIWASSAGQINGGFGSSKIELLVGQEDEGKSIAVFVKAEGLPNDCVSTASETIDVIKRMIVDPVDQFGELKPNEVKARIDNFFISIKNSPDYEGIIYVSFKKDESDAKKLRNLRYIFDAIRFRKYDVTRLSFRIEEELFDSTS